MTGVEILATSKTTVFEPNGLAFILVFIFCIILGIVFGFKDQEYDFGVLIGWTIGIGAGLLAALFVGIAEMEYYETYKVIISDEVSMNEFMDKYEILNQDGKIYTVKERVADAN